MRRTFNGGIGFVFIVKRDDEERAHSVLRGLSEAPVAMGEVVRVAADTPFEERVVWESDASALAGEP
jgi:phosphoribosylaminoimidazole (AIR) synthetase